MTISKETILPDYSIVAPNSVVNIVGIIVFMQLKATNVDREYDTQKEADLDKIYNYTKRRL